MQREINKSKKRHLILLYPRLCKDSETEAKAGLSLLPPPCAPLTPPSVYTFSGLYGSSVLVRSKLSEILDPGTYNPGTIRGQPPPL